ncbi:glycosyltransferase family 4 protein [Aquirufa sp. ROCK-SH2]
MFSKRILLFDTITDGHHPDYLYNLILYYSEKPGVELNIVSGEAFIQYLKQYFSEGILPWKNIKIHTIPSKELQEIHQKSIYLRSFLEWRLMKKYAHQLGIKKVLLMYMDYFQLGIIFGRKSGLDISGIYFRPDFIKSPTGFYAKFKRLIFQAAMSSGNIKNLFILEEKIVPALKKLSSKTRVSAICEPIQLFPISENQTIEFSKKHQLPKEKLIFLNFGYLDERKGIEVFLEACQLLKKEHLKAIALVLIGPTKPDYQAKIEELIEKNKELSTYPIWGYLPANEVQIAFNLADWALVLYQNHLGSSSVLVRAALSGKPVLGTHLGQIGELTRNKKLGLAVDASNPIEIAKNLADIIENRVLIDHKAIQQFANENSIQAFGDAVNETI